MAAERITVRVAAKGPLKKYVIGDEAVIPRGSMISSLVSYYNIPAELPVICMKDGKRLPPSTELHDGDSVIMITMMSGG